MLNDKWNLMFGGKRTAAFLVAALLIPTAFFTCAMSAMAVPETNESYWRSSFAAGFGVTLATSDDGQVFAVSDGWNGWLRAYSAFSPTPLWQTSVEGTSLGYNPGVAVTGNGVRIYAGNNLGDILAYDVSGGGGFKWRVSWGSSDNVARNIATTMTGNVTVAAFTGGMLRITSSGASAFYSLPDVGTNPSVYINADGSRILLVGANTARLLNGALTTIATVSMGSVQVVAADLSRFGQTASFMDNAGYFHVWDTSSGQLMEKVFSFPLPFYGYSVKVSGDGRYIGGSYESDPGAVFLFDCKKWGMVWTYPVEYTPSVEGINFNGDYMVARFFHQGVTIFGKEDSTPLAYHDNYNVDSVVLSPTGNSLLVSDYTGVDLFRPRLEVSGLPASMPAKWSEVVTLSVHVTATGEHIPYAAFYLSSLQAGIDLSWNYVYDDLYQIVISLPYDTGPQAVVVFVQAMANDFWPSYDILVLDVERDAVLEGVQQISNSVALLSGQVSTMNQQMNAGLNAIRSEQAALSAQLAAMGADIEAQIAALQSDLDVRLDAISAQLMALAAGLTGVQNGLASLSMQTSALDRNITALSASVAAVDAAVAGVSSQLSTALGQLTDLQASLSSMDDQLQAIASQNSAIDANLTSMSGTIGRMQTDITALGGQMAALQSSMSQVQTAVNGMSSGVDSASTRSQSASDMAMVATIAVVVMGLAVIAVVFWRTKK
jgi:peptidoglycan hydrolase CwlO-like protein